MSDRCRRFEVLEWRQPLTDDWLRHISQCPDCRAQAAIHAELGRVFAAEEPQLSSAFEHRLRARLHAIAEASRSDLPAWKPPAPSRLLRRWAIRVYWLVAGTAVALILAATVRLESDQVRELAVAGLFVAVAIQRALRPWPFRRVIRSAFFQS